MRLPSTILSARLGFARTLFVYDNQGLGFLPSSLGLPKAIDAAVDRLMFPAISPAGYRSLGGGDAGHGIHWHVAPGVQVRYLSDARRETIRTVEVTRPDGKVDRYDLPADPKAPPADAAQLEWRTMDCVDCHNRPTHQFRTAEWELDEALVDGRIDRGLPFIRREGLKALNGAYADRAAAEAGIRAALAQFYEQQQPQVWSGKKDAVLAAAKVLGEAWGQNVWPGMNIGWGTYASKLGHGAPEQAGSGPGAGCWRCHDETHVDGAGKAITQDCDNCHAILAQDEENPAILKQLGQVR